MHGWRCDCCGAFYSTSETILYENREEPVLDVEINYTDEGHVNSEYTEEYTYGECCADEPEVVNIKTLGENV